ncbi:MAG: ATP-binding protein [Cyclobacteriaceae bacterium]
MQKILITMILLAMACPLFSQGNSTDSLLAKLHYVENGKDRIDILVDLAYGLAFSNATTSSLYADSAYEEASQIGYLNGQANARNASAVRLAIQGRHSQSLKVSFEVVRLHYLNANDLGVGDAYTNIGRLYLRMKKYDQALEYLQKAIVSYERSKYDLGLSSVAGGLGRLFWELGMKDSSVHYYQKSLRISSALNDQGTLAYAKVGLGKNYLKGNPDEARSLIEEAIIMHEGLQDKNGLAKAYLQLGKTYGLIDPSKNLALINFSKSLSYAQELGSLVDIAAAYESLSEWYEANGDQKRALGSFKLFKQTEDSIASNQLFTELSLVEDDFQNYQDDKNRELELAEQEKEVLTKNLLYLIIGAFLFFGLLLSLAYIHKGRVNSELNRQNLLIANQKEEVERERNNAIQASQVKAEFLASMSHEIRTPLNAIVGFSNLLLTDTEHKPEDLNALKYSAQSLLALTDNLLDFSRLENSKIQLENIEFSIHNLVGSICNQFKAKALAKGLECFVEFDQDIPESVNGDPTRLGQILSNLVSNAIKFTDNGQVGLSANLLDTNKDSVRLQFDITDTGVGISEAKTAIIFESFRQGEAGVFRQYGGSGLGLSIVKKLTEIMDGEILVRSEVGKGSTFSLTIDLEQSLSTDQPETIKDNTEKTGTHFKGLRVLMVEDNQINWLVGERFLSKWNATTEHAENGQVGLQKLDENSYDIVLMDLEMPVMNGYEAISLIRNHEDARIRRLPIVAFTATVTRDVRADVIKLGVNDVISKPFNPDHLYNTILEHSPAWIKSGVSV